MKEKKNNKTVAKKATTPTKKEKDLLFGYIKLGRLKKPIADKIGRKPADIYIEYNYLRHIENGKGEYLISIGHNALSYVKKVVDNFMEIRKGKGNALLLVAYIKENNYVNVAVIELSLVLKSSIYLVKTAMPRRRGMANEEVVLWKK